MIYEAIIGFVAWFAVGMLACLLFGQLLRRFMR